jgi:peptidoglycan/LPS O-acetylase OafA/YrhL
VVLFALLLSSGLGSFLTAGVHEGDVAASGRRRLIGLVVVLAVFGLATPAIVRWSEPMTTAVRIVAAVIVLFPAGVMMGMAFPLGMKLAGAGARDLTPWLWGLNGAASVLASVASVCIALTWSISTAFWVGWACYLGSLIAFMRATQGSRSAAPQAVEPGSSRKLDLEQDAQPVLRRAPVRPPQPLDARLAP